MVLGLWSFFFKACILMLFKQNVLLCFSFLTNRQLCLWKSIFMLSTASQLGSTYLKYSWGYSPRKASLVLYGFHLIVFVDPASFWMWHPWVERQSKALQALVSCESPGRANFWVTQIQTHHSCFTELDSHLSSFPRVTTPQPRASHSVTLDCPSHHSQQG